VPVWHALTKELRAAGELEVIGIVQEQHAERTRLYAAWQGLDFPILWDPFGVAGVRAVLIASFIDEHGIVRATGLRPGDGEELRGLLAQRWPEQQGPDDEEAAKSDTKASAQTEPWMNRALGMVRIQHPPGSLAAARAAISRALFTGDATAAAPSGVGLDAVVAVLEERLAASDVAAADHFRAGVARRLRLDSAAARPGDMQAALDHWVAALTLDPGQYIWRRRIQQWGPRLDKPYAFYDWVETARNELAARGTPWPALAVALTGSEVADRSRIEPATAETQAPPDPERRVPLDTNGLVRVEASVAPHSDVAGGDTKAHRARVAQVHVRLEPTDGAHWTSDTEPPVLWLELPEGWSVAESLLRFRLPAGESPTGPVAVDFEVTAPLAASAGTLRAYALYSICDASDVCTFRRQNFEVQVPAWKSPDDRAPTPREAAKTP